MARRIGDLWTSFARTGVPAAAGVPEWPRHDDREHGPQRLLIIGDDGFEVGRDPATDRLIVLDRPKAWHVN